ncbi:uncharacterized protein N0V89_002119 [Didymosphaeria variabile]|uniref:Uncharacterized protein n=1 Tax=Didymosphaeria variabile TaxID=1932322 RepID=A0A9W8XTI6_9PLEO|nr:uncharacterized protein N0V89_002119 [Didymosphaeria variabile]KAJ4357543.1 hypothetical protein N0V89_002119 [Didymosphaeria variabile]
MSSSALVPYRGGPITTTVTSTSTSSLIPSRFFTAQTGHALATELFYRLLFDLLNRLVASLHRFASHQLDTFSSFLERKALERKQAQKEAVERVKKRLMKGDGKGRITEEVGKAAMKRGFISRECPMTGKELEGGKVGPPGWVGSVLTGIEEGRLVERDFWGTSVWQLGICRKY